MSLLHKETRLWLDAFLNLPLFAYSSVRVEYRCPLLPVYGPLYPEFDLLVFWLSYTGETIT